MENKITVPRSAFTKAARALDMLIRKGSRPHETEVRRQAYNGNTEAKSLVNTWDSDDDAVILPAFRYDGADFQKVSEVAATIGRSELVTAHYVLANNSAQYKALHAEAKNLIAEESSGFTGATFMLAPVRNDALQIPVAGSYGNSPEQLHVTLAHIPNVAEGAEERLREIARDFAEQFGPTVVNLNGIARFSMDDRDAIVLNADSNVLGDMRTWLVGNLESAGFEVSADHGFTPHMTLGYVGHNEAMEITRWSPRPCRLHALRLGVRDDMNRYPLNTNPQQAANPTVSNSVVSEDVSDDDGNMPDETAEVKMIHAGSVGPTMASPMGRTVRASIVPRSHRYPIKNRSVEMVPNETLVARLKITGE